MPMYHAETDLAYDLEERMLPGLTKEEFFARAGIMTHYLDHTKKYTAEQIKQAWFLRRLGDIGDDYVAGLYPRGHK